MPPLSHSFIHTVPELERPSRNMSSFYQLSSWRYDSAMSASRGKLAWKGGAADRCDGIFREWSLSRPRLVRPRVSQGIGDLLIGHTFCCQFAKLGQWPELYGVWRWRLLRMIWWHIAEHDKSIGQSVGCTSLFRTYSALREPCQIVGCVLHC